MFTGIIKDVGVVRSLSRAGGDVRLEIASAALPWRDYELGDSIAVSGVCLTAVELLDDGFVTDVSVETLEVTAMSELAVGTRVNLEPALQASDRLGGHLVSGHVDCLGKVVAISNDARSQRIGIELPEAYLRYVAKKGSICVDGVSLTINEVSGCRFELNIIPHTAESTTIADYDVGTIVNIEVDQIARYLERLLEGRSDDSISIEFLRANGYA